MFRTRASIAAALLGIGLAAPVLAQTHEKPVDINIGAGFTIPYSDSKKSFGTGGNFQFGATANISHALGIQANYFYNRFGSHDIPVQINPPIISDTPLTVNHTMHDGDFSLVFSGAKDKHVVPYGLGGIGVYHNIVNVTTPTVGLATVCDPWIYICYPVAVPVDQILGERTSTDFGLNFGGGIEVPVGETAKFYIEIRYIHTYGPTITNPSNNTSVKANGNYWPFVFGFKM